jgi:cobalt-precorrin-5B (C1)-methyltransferase
MKKKLRYTVLTPLRSGYTTGSCAAAAAKGAAMMLARQTFAAEVIIDLPIGARAGFELHGQSYSANEASCFVVKDAGDDPDVTNGAEVWATVRINPPHSPFIEGESKITIIGGTGIGKVTKPGLAIPPGEPAINPVPRRMIEQSINAVFSTLNTQDSTLSVVIAVTDGEERARKTLNARLGIIGGLSILGTTGIVRPISAKAWTDTVDAALDVAKACGCETVVLSTGRSSEMAAQRHLPGLPEEACIMMGDHIAYTLQACARRGFMKPIIACQFAKMLKIACGHANTHAAASQLDLAELRRWAEAENVHPENLVIISSANTAREVAVETRFDRKIMELVGSRARQAATVHAPGIQADTLLCGYDGCVVL